MNKAEGSENFKIMLCTASKLFQNITFYLNKSSAQQHNTCMIRLTYNIVEFVEERHVGQCSAV